MALLSLLQALSSLEEDDPNILLAIQLSLQESGLSLDDETRELVSSEASLGAIGTSLPSRLDSVPRSTENPRAALSSSELAELGDSLTRLAAECDPFPADTVSSRPLEEARRDLCPSSSDPDPAGQDPTISDNLLGNIMAWFHDMSPQSIALIPPATAGPSVEPVPPRVEAALEGMREVEPAWQGEEPEYEAAGGSQGEGGQLEGLLAEEATPSLGDDGNEAGGQGRGPGAPGQTPPTSGDWRGHAHLV